jgi:hypothetical protein
MVRGAWSSRCRSDRLGATPEVHLYSTVSMYGVANRLSRRARFHVDRGRGKLRHAVLRMGLPRCGYGESVQSAKIIRTSRMPWGQRIIRHRVIHRCGRDSILFRTAAAALLMDQRLGSRLL